MSVKRRKGHSDTDLIRPSKSTVNENQSELKEVAKDRKKTNKGPFLATSLFPLGILVGIIVGFLFIDTSDLTNIHSQLALLLDDFDFDISAKLPDIDLSRVETEWQRFRSNIPEVWKFANDGREFQVGEEFKARGKMAEFPVVIVPGIVSTGLESWSTHPSYRPFFREKLWGGFNMISQVTFNKERWINAMMLDPITGIDPPDAKIRAAEGISAAASFVQGFWLWSKIVENMAVVGYDTNNLWMAPYDWRLSFWNLEERDGYFSKMKSTIEGLKKRQGKKVVIAAHSMGSTVMLYFFKWVESPEHGKGGSDWVENHVEAIVTIAGTHLGVAKAMSAFLSGEMKDTVQMNPAGAYVLERFFSRQERQKLFRSWAGSASMWIKGGQDVWGNVTSAPDDQEGASHTHGELISFRNVLQESNNNTAGVANNMTADEAGKWILEHTPTSFQNMMATNYSFGIERDEKQLKKNDIDHTKWTNPLEHRLPNAPSMKFVCVYGHGKETERSYWYARGPDALENNVGEVADPVCHDRECKTPKSDIPMSRRSWIDADYTDDTVNPKVINGVKMGEGDGTVSLLSLGAMCVEGWKRERWNPAGIKVITVELPHQPTLNHPRGGANTSDHVDILGSTGLSEIILRVATGGADEIEDTVVSNIRQYAKKIKWD